MDLHTVLATRRDEVMRRWASLVRGEIAPESLTGAELSNHLPGFLTEIASALKEDAGLAPGGPSPDGSATAAGHGEQRLRLGFSLDAVIREYGALRDAVVAVAREAGAEITFRELHVLSGSIVTGIAQAVTEYTRQRDAELHRLVNEHYAFIAHELRNPLSSAMMAFELLKLKGLIPSDERWMLALERGLKSTSALVDQTLHAARTASGIELRRQPTTLAELFEDAEIGALAEAERKGINLLLAVESRDPVDVDRRLLSSALGNLVRNAVKYSNANATVEIRGRTAAGRVVIEVEDCCGGLAPGQVEQAFAPFARLDEREKGFGLGLAIAKQAVDAHGGTIRVQNLPGKGCIFVLEVPVSSG
jgi:signal transduction histidine kinase